VEQRPLPEQGPPLIIGVDDELEQGQSGQLHLGTKAQEVKVVDAMSWSLQTTSRVGGKPHQHDPGDRTDLGARVPSGDPVTGAEQFVGPLS